MVGCLLNIRADFHLLRFFLFQAVQAALAGAEFSTDNATLEALTVLLLAAAFFAMTALMMEPDLLLDLRLEGIGVSVDD